MKRNSILSALVSVAALVSLSLSFISCSDEDNFGAAPTVNVSAPTIQDIPGAAISFDVTVTAPNGGQLLTFAGVTLSNIPLNGSTSQVVTVNYNIPANAIVGSTILIVVTAVDNSNLNSLPATVTITVGDPVPTVIVQGNITGTQNWVASNRYLLRGKVYVVDGAILNIAAGTKIFGEKQTEGTLVVNRGGKINAVGTADDPVVFTSNAPKGFRNRGDWGGVVILGRDYNSNEANALIEGLAGAAGSDNGLYGPKDGAAVGNDNSGVLQYVRIEFAGIDLSQDNELNSLTMGSVGSGTTIDHIVVSYANDDAYEWFGGSVNHKYLVAYSTLDDDFDTDRGYIGKVQFGAVIREATIADISGSRAFESSSNSNATPPTVGGVSRHSKPVFANITVLGPLMFRAANQIDGFYRAAVEVNSFNELELQNSILTGFPNAANFATAGSSVKNNVFAKNTTQTATGANAPADFATDNTLESDVTSIFGAFASGSVYSFENLPMFQTATSPYLTGAPAIADAFFEAVSYYGAFGTTAAAGWNFNAGWINLDPNNQDY